MGVRYHGKYVLPQLCEEICWTPALNVHPCVWVCVQVCRLSPFDPPPFDSSMLKVEFTGGSSALAPHPSLAPRRYTLTHNDFTGELALSIGREFNVQQVRSHTIKSSE